MKQFYEPLENGIHAKAFLFDPEFRHNAPLLVQHESEISKNSWETLDYNLFRRGRLLLYVSNAWLDFQSVFHSELSKYITKIIQSQGAVFLGVFTQPYTRVEENNDIIQIYNRIQSNTDPHLKNNLQV